MPYNLRWNNPRYWHRRAEEARTIAETMNNIEARGGMQRLAADYEAMAQRAEEWSAQTERRSGALTEIDLNSSRTRRPLLLESKWR
jgi:hypothetical protein